MSDFSFKDFSRGTVIPVEPTQNDSHQTSPGWLLTFVSFSNPETTNPTPTEGFSVEPDKDRFGNKIWPSQKNSLKTKDIVSVTTDCVDVMVSHSKSSPLGNFKCTLTAGKYNYMAIISPGDYVAVNIMDFNEEIYETKDQSKPLAERAENGSAINLFNDGFKGMYKVTSIRQQVFVSPESGIKRLVYLVEGQSFTELNNSIYFNPYLAISPSVQGQDTIKKLTDQGLAWQNRVGFDSDLQSIMVSLTRLILGGGPTLRSVAPVVAPSTQNNSATIKDKSGVLFSPNQTFQVSKSVSGLLGVSAANTFNQLYRYLFGVQKYEKVIVTRKRKGKTEKIVFNPSGYFPTYEKNNSNNFYESPVDISGLTLIRPEYFNQATGWSILQSYVNPPINEMFTCYRLSPEGMVMPFLVFRQIPFTSRRYASRNKRTTEFLSLPRWELNAKMVRSFNIGRDDSLRFNFVQVFGLPFGWAPEAQQEKIAIQNANGQNYSSDSKDIARSGLKPYVVQNSLDFPGVNGFQSQIWAKLLGDAIIGSHMKLSGTFVCEGIQLPITVGDNLLFDGIVYHIEQIVHDAKILQNGNKTFSTVISVSHGVDVTSNDRFTVYGKTVNSLYDDEFERDAPNGILPAVIFEEETK